MSTLGELYHLIRLVVLVVVLELQGNARMFWSACAIVVFGVELKYSDVLASSLQCISTGYEQSGASTARLKDGD
jgi:hypothetical protein